MQKNIIILNYIQKRFVSDFNELRKLTQFTRDVNNQILKEFNAESLEDVRKRTEEALCFDEIELKTDIKIENLDNISQNIKDTKIFLEQISIISKNIKKQANDLDVKIVEINDKNSEDNFIILKNIKKNNDLINIEGNAISDNIKKAESTVSKILDKSIFSKMTDFVYSLHDMLNLPGKLVLYTVSGGIVLYGAYKLGSGVLKFFDFRSNNSSVQPQPITIINQQPSLTLSENSNQNNRSNNEGFFKQVGDRVLKLLDIIINKYQYKKYK